MSSRRIPPHNVGITVGINNGINNGVTKWKDGVLSREWRRECYWMDNSSDSGLRELRRVGVDAGSLRRGGYEAAELLNVGYTTAELLKGGFSQEELSVGTAGGLCERQ